MIAAKLGTTLRDLQIVARHADQLQHAGISPGPACWSDIHDACNRARAVLAEFDREYGVDAEREMAGR